MKSGSLARASPFTSSWPAGAAALPDAPTGPDPDAGPDLETGPDSETGPDFDTEADVVAGPIVISTLELMFE